MTDLEPIPDSALKRLGGELAQLLDDDLWNNTEKRYLLPALEEQEVLRSKLLDAEALLTDARECRDYYKHRAQAAEAEVARLRNDLLAYGHHLESCKMLCIAKTDGWKIAKLHGCSCGFDTAKEK